MIHIKFFLLQQLGVLISTYGVGFLIFKIFFPQYFFPFLAVIPAFFYLLHYIFYALALKTVKEDHRKFPSRFLVLFGVKIGVLLIFILLYSVTNPDKAVPFLISFFVVYLINTIFLVFKVVKLMKSSH